jgi:hypothetical protein
MTGSWAQLPAEDKLAKAREVFDQIVLPELQRAWGKFPQAMNSTHEGYAVLLEEVDEMWDEIKANRHDNSVQEASQVAAMALRYIVEMIR